jgi:aryl-alcohol dehydrogenase-like predicted oxidoreductase
MGRGFQGNSLVLRVTRRNACVSAVDQIIASGNFDPVALSSANSAFRYRIIHRDDLEVIQSFASLLRRRDQRQSAPPSK